jgi:murein DD-endopeptidase MepM/ murein hydrolase activator NlpD
MLTVATAHEAVAAEDELTFLYFPHASTDVEFMNDWGLGRSGGRRHRGTDVFSDKGTEVVAVADGFVERIKVSKRSGWYIKLRHAGEWDTYYMHLNNDTPGTDDNAGDKWLAVVEGLEVGDFVAAGDVVGYVGDSGNAEWTSPHTHFEVHRNGKAVNPFRFLDAAWDRKMNIQELVDKVR